MASRNYNNASSPDGDSKSRSKIPPISSLRNRELMSELKEYDGPLDIESMIDPSLLPALSQPKDGRSPTKRSAQPQTSSTSRQTQRSAIFKQVRVMDPLTNQINVTNNSNERSPLNALKVGMSTRRGLDAASVPSPPKISLPLIGKPAPISHAPSPEPHLPYQQPTAPSTAGRMSSTAASSKPVSRNMSVQRSSIASSVTGASMLEEEQQDSKLSSMERIDDLIVKYREVLERRKDDFYEQRHIRIDDLPRRLDPEKYPDIFASISSMSSSRRTSSGLRRSLSAGSRRRDSNSSTTSDELRRRSSVSGSLRSLRSLSRPGTGTERRKRQRSKAKSAAQNANGVRFSLNSAQDISSVIQSEVKENQDVVMIDLETPQQAPYASPFLLRAVFRPNINEPRIADPVEPDLNLMVVGTGQATNEEEKFSVEEQQTEIRPQSKGVKRKADWSQAMMEALYDWDASTEEEKLEVMGESVARNSWSAAPPRLTWHNPAEGGGMADSSGVKLFDKLGAETGPTKPEELSAEDYYASLEMSSFFPTFMQPEKREKFMLRRAMEKDLDFDFRRLNFLRQTNSESVKNSAEVLSENQDAKKDSAIAGAASAVDRPQLPPLVSIEEEPEEEEEEPHPPKTAATKAPPDTADSSSSTVKSGASNELKTQSASSQSSVASGGPKPQQRELLVDDQKPQSSAATQDNLKPLSAISTDNSQKPHSATTEKSQSSADERQKPQSGAPNDSDDRLSGGPIPQSPHIAATTPKEITEQLLDHAFKKAPDEFAKAEGEGNEGNNFGTNLTKKASQKSDLFLSHNSSNRLGGHSRSSINMNCEYTGYKSKETFREKRLRAIKSSRVPVVESESRAATANGTPIISDPYSAICLRDVMKDDDSRVYPWISDCVADHGTEEDLRKVKKELESRAVPFPSDVRRYSLMLALRHRYADAIAVLNPSINVEPAVESLWLRHQIHLKSNDLYEALGDLNEITEANPKHYAAWFAKARLLKIQKRLRDALPAYDQCVRLRPMDPAPVYERCLVFEELGETAKAYEDILVVIHLQPDNSVAIRKKAKLAAEKKLWLEAIVTIDSLLQSNPEDYDLRLSRGKAFARVCKWEEAMQDANFVARMSPSNGDAFYFRGCLLKNRNPVKAIEDFSTSLLLDNSERNKNAYIGRAFAYLKLKMYNLAALDFQMALSYNNDNSICHFNLAILYSRHLNDSTAAVNHLNSAIESDPIFAKAYINRGLAYEIMHREAAIQQGLRGLGEAKKRENINYMDKAIREFSKAIHLNPNSPILYIARGRMLYKQERIREALVDFGQAAMICRSDSGKFRQRVLMLLLLEQYEKVVNEIGALKVLDGPTLLLRIKTNIKARNFEDALADLDKAIHKDKNDLNLHVLKGICLEKLKKYHQATHILSEVIDKMPKNPKAYYHRAVCRLSLNDPKGINDLTKAIKCNSRYYEALLSRALYLGSKGEFKEALQDCDAAFRIEPGSLALFVLSGILYARVREFDMARDRFARAVEIDPKCVVAFFSRAFVSHVNGDFKKALTDYSLALMIDPKNPTAYRLRAYIYLKKDMYANAIPDLQAALEADPGDVELNALLGSSLQRLDKLDLAIDAYTKSLEKAPFVYENILARGNAYAQKKEYRKARIQYSKVLRLNPTNTEAWVNIAYSFQLEKRFPKALEAFQSALAINPESSLAHEGQAIIYMILNDSRSALININKAIQLNNKSAELYANRGVIYQMQGQHISAAQDFKMAIELRPDYQTAYFNLGNLYLKYNQLEFALEAYDKAFELNNRDYMTILNRAIAKSIVKDIDGAEADFQLALELGNNPLAVLPNRAKFYMVIEKFAEAEKDYRQIIANDPSQAKQLSIMLTEARFRRTTVREEYEEDMRALLKHHLMLTDSSQDQAVY